MERTGRAFVAWDRAPQLAGGGVVHYTLHYRDPGQGWVVLAEQSISLDNAPRITRLLAPYPNPANPRVVIRSYLRAGSMCASPCTTRQDGRWRTSMAASSARARVRSCGRARIFEVDRWRPGCTWCSFSRARDSRSREKS